MSMGGGSLLSVGEACLHLICELLRREPAFSYLHRVPPETLVALSRLSRTCRALYIAVRNLPSITERPPVTFTLLRIPPACCLRHMAYWSDLGGLVWQLSEVKHVLQLCEHSEKDGGDDEMGPSQKFQAASGRAPAFLAKIFVEPNLERLADDLGDSFSDCLNLIRQCGGLRVNATEESCPDLAQYKNLRVLSLEAGSKALATQAGTAITEYLRNPPTVLRYTDVRLMLFGQRLPLDVTPYALAQRVMLQGCSCVDDFAGLSRVPDVMVTKAVTLRDLTPFRNTLNLIIGGAGAHMDLSILKHARTLKLTECHRQTEVKGLANLRNLDVTECDALCSVAELADITTAYIHECPSLARVQSLSRLHHLTLCWCHGLELVTGISDVHKLVIEECPLLVRVEGLERIAEVVIEQCEDLSTLRDIHDVHSMRITEVGRLSDLSGLAEVQEVTLNSCANVANVAPLAGATTLSIKNCPKVTDMSMLGTVSRLDLA